MEPVVVVSMFIAGAAVGVLLGGFAVLSRLRRCMRSLDVCQRATGELTRLLRLYRACCGIGDRDGAGVEEGA